MPKRRDLPDFASYKEAGEWLDNHSTADLRNKPTKFAVSPDLEILLSGSDENRIETISIRKQMSRQIRGIARRHGLSATRLVENWLREKIQENMRPSV